MTHDCTRKLGKQYQCELSVIWIILLQFLSERLQKVRKPDSLKCGPAEFTEIYQIKIFVIN